MPWLLGAIVGLALVYTVDAKLGMEKVVENQLALSPKQSQKLDQLSPDQRAAQINTIVKFNRVVAYAFPVFALVITVIVAGVLLGTFKVGFDARLTFKQALAISMYAGLPNLIKGLIAVFVVGIGGAEGFTFQNPVASNLGALVDPSSRFLYSIATSLDIFGLWIVVLTGLGYACVTGVKRGTCMAVVFGWWALLVLCGAGLSAIFS